MAGIEYDDLDPRLIAQIEDHFARTFNAEDLFDLFDDIKDVFDAVHPLDLLDEVLTSEVPDQAEQAYGEMVIDAINATGDGDWDGDLL
ncbi:hypothetical protein [Streptomyces zaomyceticus]|uniref:Acyl carrier protein n=1 Tax=Streptomyces zaomyceticus TaxID=68286 RepID=A0ABZ1LR50_9ACTN|nr:hypothetical protein OG237_42290 [Streptomyces zaomyceticus]